MENKTDLSRPNSLREYLRLYLTGLAMGGADIIPGVSGGTMAFILGVYEALLDGIKSVNAHSIRLALRLKIKELFDYVPWKFLLALGLGIGTAILVMSRTLSAIMDDPTGRIYLFAFFFGLIMASIVAIGAKVRWAAVPTLTLALGAVVAFVIVNIVPAEGSHDLLSLFLAGMVAICAMILPGISGAFILLILGQYDYVLTAVSNRDILPVAVVGAGCVLGIMLFSRVLSWLLRHYHMATVASLVGFMVGSLWKIWPWKECLVSDLDRHGELRCLQEGNLLPNFGSSEFMLALGLAVFGFLLVSLMDHLQSGTNPFFRLIWRRPVVDVIEEKQQALE